MLGGGGGWGGERGSEFVNPSVGLVPSLIPSHFRDSFSNCVAGVDVHVGRTVDRLMTYVNYTKSADLYLRGWR